jgi:hypothetical protein
MDYNITTAGNDTYLANRAIADRAHAAEHAAVIEAAGGLDAFFALFD